jgi:hypothetical protein
VKIIPQVLVRARARARRVRIAVQKNLGGLSRKFAGARGARARRVRIAGAGSAPRRARSTWT